ncbi:hypothetical protein H8K32_02960 [Undibacterium jejuense]|uniref:Uncharacterized protein n=1 Tax=Undibacterium jejuense TaxID=1344949 RepID=A0A923HG84_9BURK|nr:hypothetical protein [Undibacterium jejuense]
MLSTTPHHSSVIEFPVPQAWRDIIYTVIFDVMEDNYASVKRGAFGKCAEFAIVGARVLKILTNAPYKAVGGGQIMDCGDEQYVLITPTRNERRNARNLAEMKFYHCWVQLDAQSMSTGGIEFVDFTLLYDRLTAHLLNKPYTLSNSAAYFWGDAKALDLPIPASLNNHPSLKERQSGWYWTDSICCRLLLKYENENAAYFSALTSKILYRIADEAEKCFAPTSTASW